MREVVKLFKRVPPPWIGVGLGIFYWFLESALDTFVFHEGDLSDAIFVPNTDIFLMRLTVISILAIFGFYVQSLTKRRIIERTAQLEAIKGVLKVERDRLINIMESMGDGVYIENQAHDVEYINSAIEREFGPIDGRKCYEYFNHRDAVDSWCKNKEVFAGKTVRWEWHFNKNNKIYDLLETPLQNQDKIISKLGIFRDITERKKAEHNLSIQCSVASVLAESATLKEVAPKIIEAVCESTGWDMGAIWIVDHSEGVLRCIEHWHKPSVDLSKFEVITRQYNFSRGVGLPGRVWETGKPAWIIDITKDTNFLRSPYAARMGLHSAFCFPIKFGSEVLGVIEFFSRETRKSDDGLLQMFNAIGSQIGQLIGQFMERKKVEDQNSHMAYYDILTQLPNRLSLHDDIDRAISQARKELVSFALLIINLDRFEEINNTVGHPNGDLILQQIAIRLQWICGEPNRIARMGGDIFAAILQMTDAEGAAKKAAGIIGAIKEPLSIANISLEVSASIGIALFPGYAADADTLIRYAEIAMYAAKKTEGSICTYSPQHDQYSQKRLVLMGELRQAIEQEQMFLLYQPKLDLKTGKTIGVEALCRWQHPKLGVIPPNDFIYLAERGGLIKELTLWVIKESMCQSRIWHKEGFEVAVATNISVRNLHDPQLIDKIKGLISTWGITLGALRFEITESIIMQNPELVMETITELTSMGIKFSIDDFGTGYSSLSYLQRLPVDEIKIDKSFVINMETDKNNTMIVHSVIELAHNLGMKVTAEGVENKEVMDKLISLGCDDAQGYYISKPITHEELVSWMGKQ